MSTGHLTFQPEDQETVDIYAGADAGPADDADARAC